MKVNEERFGYRFSFERARAFSREKCGDDGKKDTPVPISNTEVHDLTAICDCVVGQILRNSICETNGKFRQ